MNERIKELAEQANAWYPMGYPSGEGGDAAWENLVIFEKEDLEKFAQLIIKDCVSQIAMIGVSNFENDDVGWTVDKSIENIRTHFGVE